MKNYFSPGNRIIYCGAVLIPRILRKLLFAGTHLIKSDELYLKLVYFLTFGKWLDLKHPEKLQNFNEKIQWLKLYEDTPVYAQMADKYEVRRILREKLGREISFPLLGVWERFEEIDFAKLPDKFVLKATHDSGSIVFCRGKEHFDRAAAREKLSKSLKRNYYWYGRERPYKNIPPRIIAEPLMTDNESGTDLKDYKLFCCDGEVKMIQVDYDRFINHHRNLYTPAWELIDAFILYPNNPDKVIPQPEVLPEMLKIAGELSKGFPFVRIDLYVINGQIYFGEFTFHHESGWGRIRPREFNRTMGDWIKLPVEKQ